MTTYSVWIPDIDRHFTVEKEVYDYVKHLESMCSFKFSLIVKEITKRDKP